MTRDGLVEVNETQETEQRISSRARDADFSRPAGRAEPDAPAGKKQRIGNRIRDADPAKTEAAAPLPEQAVKYKKIDVFV